MPFLTHDDKLAVQALLHEFSAWHTSYTFAAISSGMYIHSVFTFSRRCVGSGACVREARRRLAVVRQGDPVARLLPVEAVAIQRRARLVRRNGEARRRVLVVGGEHWSYVQLDGESREGGGIF